jgi:hypothetical protein
MLVAAIDQNTDTRFHVCKSMHDEAHSASLCQQFFDSLLQEFRVHRPARTPGGSDYQEMPDLVHEAVRIFDTLAPLIKHPDLVKKSAS